MKTLKKRRRENKTDYKKRLGLLKSGRPRIVFRRTNKYIIAQYVKSEEAKDKVVLGVTSKDLLKHGWAENAVGSLKSIPSSYMIGVLVGKKILAKKLEMPIIDLGIIRTLHKTRAYAFLKGVIDSGLEISCPEECFPDEAKIKGEFLKNKISFEEIKSKINNAK